MRKHILITGTNRGLGLGFTTQYLKQGHTVFALTRKPEAPELASLRESNPRNLFLIRTDITSKADLQRARDEVKKHASGIDILINNAGQYGTSYTVADPNIDEQELLDIYRANVVGPLLVTNVFLPLLKTSTDKKLIYISTLMASIEDNKAGGSYAYRLSKSALNMMNKNISIDVKDMGITSIAIHPGWVKTDMGGQNAPLDIETSVMGMIAVIKNVSPAQSGTFLDYRGQKVSY